MAIDVTTISIGSLLTGVVACFLCVIRHVSQRDKHPCSKDLVYEDVCEERGKSNDQEHHHLKEGIEDLKNETRQGFKAVNQSMEKGFDKLETLIRKNGG